MALSPLRSYTMRASGEVSGEGLQHACFATDAPWRRDSAAAAAAADGRRVSQQLQPPPPRPAAEWPDAHGAVTADHRGSGEEADAEKPPTYKAFAFNDEEFGGAELAGAFGLGMLGYRFHRRTTVNWWAPRRPLNALAYDIFAVLRCPLSNRPVMGAE